MLLFFGDLGGVPNEGPQSFKKLWSPKNDGVPKVGKKGSPKTRRGSPNKDKVGKKGVPKNKKGVP